MINYKVLIGGIDYTNAVTMPFKEQYVLDSALDNGTMRVFMISKSDKFKPYTNITITKASDTYTFCVFDDKITEVVGSGLYNHDLVLIEETKLIEKKVVDTNTTTQYLIHDYLSVAVNAPYTVISGTAPEITDIKTPANINVAINLNSLSNVWGDYLPSRFDNGRISIFINDASIAYYTVLVSQSDYTREYSFTPVETGTYKLTYYAHYTTGLTYTENETNFTFQVINQPEPKASKSITYVVNRLLAITETLRASQTPALTFNAEQSAFYDNVVAPEFAMTKSTLRECLDQVGSYIHSIVRLEGNVIYFDKLGDAEQTTLPSDYIGHYETLDSEQYATQLDSIVDNLVNIDNSKQGTITEPFTKGYETVRASGTIRIGNDSTATAIIETEYPIERVEKLICGYLTIGSDDVLVGDITPYVFENAEYQALSGTTGQFPNSKGYALTFTQGQNNITGLTFTLPNPISSVFTKTAIVNIIEAKLGRTIQNIFNVQKLTELNFQLIYYPATKARVKQSKSYLGDYDQELTSIYNQSANKIDSRAYGENLKGAIARLGNVEKFITFYLNTPDNLPNVGNVVIIDNEDYYIATLNVENLIDYTKCTVGLSKDFNALSKYIGIKNNIRLYEVSEKQSVERFITYDDYCVIGDSIASDNLQIITQQAINNSILQFNGATNTTNSVSVARLQGYDETGYAEQQVDLPVFSLGAGNSIWLGCRYRDNYSAGNTSEYATSSTGDNYYRVQNYVPYCDYWGEIETLNVKMYDYLADISSSAQAIEVGNALPKSDLATSRSPLIDTLSDNLVIKKDSRENINLSYQIYFVTNDNSYIIGSQLGQGNPLTTNFDTSSASLYVLPTRINKFASTIDLTNATLIKNYNGDTTDIITENNQIVFSPQTSLASGNSWALVDNATGNLLFGRNIAITQNGTIEMPTMTYTHKVIGR